MADAADLVFLPWVRRGAAAAVQAPDSGGDQPGVGAATVSLTLNARQDVAVPVTVMGPGHVTGLDSRQIVRTDPAPGSRSFEPNYFPLIELDEPSLPWLFTPAAAGAQARLRPWLCLVVVRAQAGVGLDPPRLGPLPVLRIGSPASPAAELPDLADSWAWAHGQVTATAGAPEGALLDQLKFNPERSIARLLCARVLRPDTDYLACVVPTFELGRKAGLGESVTAEDEAHLAPAWKPAATAVELPVYFSWTFATGAGGDFQSLAMLLRARPLPEGVGLASIDIGESGLAAVPAGTTLPLAGALRPVGAPEGRWPGPSIQSEWEIALTPVLNAPATVTAEEDPVLAPPLYGAAQAGVAQLDPGRPARWFEQLNLSPAHRAVAHLGTRVVREQQDALMASAWAQAAELEKVNQLLRQAQLGCRVAGSLHSRFIARMDAAVGLQVLAPALARMTRSAVGSTPEAGLARMLFATGLDAPAFATALRRMARPRGAINRRVQRVAESPVPIPRTTSVLLSLQPSRLNAPRLHAPDERISLERVGASLAPARTDITWGEATEANVAAAPGRAEFAFVPLGAHVPMPPRTRPFPGVFQRRGPTPAERAQLRRRIRDDRDFPGDDEPEPEPEPEPEEPTEPPPPPVDNAAAALFRALAQAHLARFIPPSGPAPAAAEPRDGLLSAAFAVMLARATPRESFAIRTRAALTIPGPSRSEDRAFEPVGLSPAFPQPMVEALTEIAQDYVLPGLDLVPPNTVVALETNPAFVEAYLVGLNTEMGRELVWRGYPADLSATYFDRFWNAAAAPERAPDIEEIAAWGDRPLGASGGGEDFVMLVRSELLRRYPNAVVYATKPDAPDRPPIFTGGFAPDLRYVGFDIPVAEIGDWSIVIQEHPSAPRFGIEDDDETGAATHVAPPEANAALVAARTRQMPVRITLPSSILLGTA